MDILHKLLTVVLSRFLTSFSTFSLIVCFDVCIPLSCSHIEEQGVMDALLDLDIIPRLFLLMNETTNQTDREKKIRNHCLRILVQLALHSDVLKWQGSYSNTDFASLLQSNFFVCEFVLYFVHSLGSLFFIFFFFPSSSSYSS